MCDLQTGSRSGSGPQLHAGAVCQSVTKDKEKNSKEWQATAAVDPQQASGRDLKDVAAQGCQLLQLCRDHLHSCRAGAKIRVSIK